MKEYQVSLQGWGTCVPPAISSKETYELFEKFGTPERPWEWYEQRIGIPSFSALRMMDSVTGRPGEFIQWLGKNISARDGDVEMSILAGQAALKAAGIPPQEIQEILYVNCTGSVEDFASDLRKIQNGLGLPRHISREAHALGCGGGIWALHKAAERIEAGLRETILVIGSNDASRHRRAEYLDYRNALLSVVSMFGDGAAAFVLQRNQPSARYKIIKHCEYHDSRPDAQEPDLMRVVDKVSSRDGQDVVRIFIVNGPAAVEEYKRSMDKVLDMLDFDAQDVNFFALHQVNPIALRRFCEEAGFPSEKVIVVAEKVGNGGAFSAMFALTEALNQSKEVAHGQIVSTAMGAGAGVVAAGLLIHW